MSENDSLKRFLDAQKLDYQIAFSEIQKGKKQSHWMWYIFPQIVGLGQSQTARFFEIKNLTEAEAFFKHPILGSRLMAISKELLKLKETDAHKIFGSPDDLKLKSSMTLFSLVPHSDTIFEQVLEKYFDGQKDEKTVVILGKA
ncbi:DUF1810 domain-containing protein [Pedobacter paludis]|uniref:DUF1810 domain-containing protein n=1 Tax=Pedobacter paludis TaxID=2203212 RepID=A0A317F1N8_9SPHI|nr:DUF1810 domain-containing protein [Pedobacter paludis]PWS33101.1 DUF1810 domain-containing protein [Pedobacter paludis]